MLPLPLWKWRCATVFTARPCSSGFASVRISAARCFSTQPWAVLVRIHKHTFVHSWAKRSLLIAATLMDKAYLVAELCVAMPVCNGLSVLFTWLSSSVLGEEVDARTSRTPEPACVWWLQALLELTLWRTTLSFAGSLAGVALVSLGCMLCLS
jgi:hypothetical protein